MPLVSVVVPARDAAATLPATLAGLAEQELEADYEVIVVDNGSSDSTLQIACASEVGDKVIALPRGSGPGAARNAGAAVAAGEILAFLDADCVPAGGWLAAGVDATRRGDLVQGRVLPDPATPPGPFDRSLTIGAPSGLFESANLFVRRSWFERLGGFPAGLEDPRAGSGRAAAPFGEDVLFGWRAVRAGARTGFCAEALAHHAVFPRGPLGYAAEQARLALFPPLAAAVPELREGFFFARVFHSRRSAAFDLAVAGAAGAVLARRPALLALAAPYAVVAVRQARPWGRRRAAAVALAGLAADAVGLVGLIRGSLAARELLL